MPNTTFNFWRNGGYNAVVITQDCAPGYIVLHTDGKGLCCGVDLYASNNQGHLDIDKIISELKTHFNGDYDWLLEIIDDKTAFSGVFEPRIEYGQEQDTVIEIFSTYDGPDLTKQMQYIFDNN